MPMKIYNDAEVKREKILSYIAGFVDGEGSVCISIRKDRDKPYCRPNFEITQTDKSILEWIIKELGSSYKTVHRKQYVKASYKQAYHVMFGDREAYKILKILYPYLRLKREQAKLIFSFYEEYENERNYSPIKLKLALKCKELNYGTYEKPSAKKKDVGYRS